MESAHTGTARRPGGGSDPTPSSPRPGVRPAREDDLDGLAELAAELHQQVIDTGIAPFATRADETVLHAALFGAAPYARAFVADSGRGVLEGFALWHHVLSVRDGQRSLHVDELFVSARCREAGLGSELFRALGREALTAGCAYLTWEAVRWDSRRVALSQGLRAAPLDDQLIYSVDARHLQRLVEG